MSITKSKNEGQLPMVVALIEEGLVIFKMFLNMPSFEVI